MRLAGYREALQCWAMQAIDPSCYVSASEAEQTITIHLPHEFMWEASTMYDEARWDMPVPVLFEPLPEE